MAKGVTIDILGNAAGLQAALSEASAAIKGLDTTVKSSSATQVTETRKAGKAHKSLSDHIIGVGAAFLGVEAIFKGVDYLKDSAKVAGQAQRAHDILSKAISNVGITNKKTADLIDRQVEQMAKKYGFLETQVSGSYSVLLTATKHQSSAFTGLNLAFDIARARGISLQQATILVAKAQEGVTTGLKRLGITVPKITTEQDKLTKAHDKATLAGAKFDAQATVMYNTDLKAAKAADKHATSVKAIGTLFEKFGGQAATAAKGYQGTSDRFAVANEDFEKNVGKHLQPGVKKAQSAWIDLENAPKKTVERWGIDEDNILIGLGQKLGEIPGVIHQSTPGAVSAAESAAASVAHAYVRTITEDLNFVFPSGSIQTAIANAKAAVRGTTQGPQGTGTRTNPSVAPTGPIGAGPSGMTPRRPGATGMYISGRYGADDVHVSLTGSEAVLNPHHIAMVDSGRYSVLGALRATGAPTIRRGSSHADGGIPEDLILQQKIRQLQATLISEQKHLDPLSKQITSRENAIAAGRAHLVPAKQKELHAKQEASIHGFMKTRDDLKIKLQRRETAQRSQLSNLQNRYSVMTSAAPGALAFNQKLHPLETALARANQQGTNPAGPTAALVKAYQARIRFLNVESKKRHSRTVLDQIQQELASDYTTLQDYQTGHTASFDSASLTFLSPEHQYQLDKALMLDANGNPVDPATAASILGTELANMQRGEGIAVASGNYALADQIVQDEANVKAQLSSLSSSSSSSGGSNDPDLQAQLAQSQGQVAALTRAAGYTSAFDAVSRGAGDLGIMVLGDTRSLSTYASSVTRGLSLQPSISQNSGRITV